MLDVVVLIYISYTYATNKQTNTDLSSLKLPNVKAEFLPLLSNMIIQNWQLRLLDVIGEGYSIIQVTIVIFAYTAADC